MIILPIYQGTQKVASFQWYLGQKKTLQQVPAALHVLLPLGLCDPAGLMVLGVSIVECHDIRSLCHAPISDPQKGSWGFWNKVLSPTADNYSPLERQLLACFGALWKPNI